MKHLTKSLTLAGVAIAVATPALASSGATAPALSRAPASGAASAAAVKPGPRNGHCEKGEFCLYYKIRQGGSVSDFDKSVDDYGTKQPSCFDFKGKGAGKGACVKNKALSVWNRTGKTVQVYYNSGYGGAHQDFKAGAKGDLDTKLRHENASHHIGVLEVGAAQKPRDDYDGNPRHFAQNNCTAFAAYRIASRLGVPKFNDFWKGVTWGNAGHWDNAARAVGVKVDKKPRVGAIAVNDVHKVGHVAYVNKVHADGSFDVEEYNWNHHLRYGTRKHVRVNNGQASFQYMLHF